MRFSRLMEAVALMISHDGAVAAPMSRNIYGTKPDFRLSGAMEHLFGWYETLSAPMLAAAYKPKRGRKR